MRVDLSDVIAVSMMGVVELSFILYFIGIILC